MASTPNELRDGDCPAPGGDASLWAKAWDRELDAEASESWMRLRAELDPLLEAHESSGDLGLDRSVPNRLAALLDAARSDFDLLRPPADDPEQDAGRAAGAERPHASPLDAGLGTLRPGTLVGGCETVRLAGRGGMGEVYEAIDRSLGAGSGRRVALKLLPAAATGPARTSLGASLHRDVAALARLEHPSIARLYRAGVDRTSDGVEHAYLVTEFIDGVPMLQFVEGRCADQVRGGDPRCRANLAIELGERLCEALAAAHAQGVVHRDVKSSNVLVRQDASLALVDFGIAALAEAEGSADATLADRLTMQPDAAGSLSAISPERARGRFGGPREDVWALGVLLFEIAAARRPIAIEGLSIYEAIRRIGDAPPPPIRSVDAEVPRDLAVVIDRCLAFDPADRYPDAAAVRDELALVRHGFAPRARPIGAWGRSWRLARRYPVASVLAIATALALIAGTLVAGALAVQARRSQAIAEDREQIVRTVADGLLVEVADTLRTIPGATAARQRLLEIGLAYAEAVGDESFLASDRDAALELARAVFTLGELHRQQQPNASEDELGRAAFERTSELARLAAQASGGPDAEALGLAANADSLAIEGRPGASLQERSAAWSETIDLAEQALAVDPRQADALIGLYRSCLRIGDRARLDGDRDRAMAFFARALEATERLVEAHPALPRAWFHHGAALNSMWWLLYKNFQEGNEARILETFDAMIDAERREDAILSTTNSRSNMGISRMLRTYLAIEFGLIDGAEAEATLAELEASIVAISESEPDLGLLRRRRAEAHLRRGQALELLVNAAIAAGDETEARRLAADAAVAFESLVEVQRDRLARREQVAENEDAMLAYGLEHAAAMRAVAEGPPRRSRE